MPPDCWTFITIWFSMKILVLLSRVPYPLEKGDKLRAYHQLQHLAQNHRIILCCLNDSKLHPEALKHLEPLCEEIKIIKLSRWRIILNLIKGLFSDKPLQVSYFYHQQAQKKIDRLIEKHLPGHIFCQLIRVSEYVRKYSVIPKTLDYMDALSKGVERRMHKSRPWWRPIMKMEARRLVEYEREMFPVFNHHTIISQQDKELIHHDENSSIAVIPNGVDTSFFHPMEATKDYDLVFTGNMSYPPNVDSARYLVKEILPLVWEKRPETKLLISGAVPAPQVKQLDGDRVKVTGWVEDIRDSYARARVFIAPMQIGTGLQNKLLEAMAMKLPCITSPLANNALGADPGKHILIGTQPEEYAREVIRLLDDQEFSNEIAAAGYQFVRSAYDWNETTNRLEDLMKVPVS